jgi:succinate dehydrogenase / fumarate reductase flavoprotein subunit
VASRNAKHVIDEGRGVGQLRNGVYLDFAGAIAGQGRERIGEKYGNLFEMYERITGENPYQTPMRIYPAPHYTMGGLWVDYDLQSNLPGLFVLGEANFSDHGANRLGASALMQGLADGYFIAPYTIAGFLSGRLGERTDTASPAFERVEREVRERIERLLAVQGRRTVDELHRELGRVVWNECGMSRRRDGLERAIAKVRGLRDEFWGDLKVVGTGEELNQSLERAGRVADFLELAELMCVDALDREESCGGHFREEYQTPEGEALRDDERWAGVSVWEMESAGAWRAHREPLLFENVTPSTRSYR